MTFLLGIGGAAGAGGGLPQTVGAITAVGTPLALQSSDVNIAKSILSTVQLGTVKMPAANTSGFTPGPINYPILNAQGSQLIKVKNGGVEGTDATLEAILVPNAQMNFQLRANAGGTQYGQAYSAAAGLWDKQALLSSVSINNNMLAPKMLVPISPDVAPPRLDLGTTSFGTVNELRVPLTVMTTGLLGLLVFMDSSNNVRGIPFQCSADGVTNQVMGTNTQIAANGGATLQYPWAVKIDGTRVLVGWWDSTNTKNVYAVVTITAGSLPSAPTIAIGTAQDDATLVGTAAQRIQLPGNTGCIPVQDQASGNFWHIGMQTTTGTTCRPRAYYISIAGTTITMSAQLEYDTSSSLTSLTSQFILGASCAANKLIVPGTNNANIIVLSFGGGAITVAGTIYDANHVQNFANVGNTAGAAAIYPLDPTNQIYLLVGPTSETGGNAANANGLSRFEIVKLDVVSFAVLRAEYLGNISHDISPSSSLYLAYPGQWIQIGLTGEFLALNGQSSINAASGGPSGGYRVNLVGYIDMLAANLHTIERETSQPNISTTTYNALPDSMVGVRFNVMPGVHSSPVVLSIGLDPTTRRAAVTYRDAQISTGNNGYRVHFMELPRR